MTKVFGVIAALGVAIGANAVRAQEALPQLPANASPQEVLQRNTAGFIDCATRVLTSQTTGIDVAVTVSRTDPAAPMVAERSDGPQASRFITWNPDQSPRFFDALEAAVITSRGSLIVNAQGITADPPQNGATDAAAIGQAQAMRSAMGQCMEKRLARPAPIFKSGRAAPRLPGASV